MNLKVAKTASALVLLMAPVARVVCMASGGDLFMEPDSAAEVSQILHDYFAPDAPNMAH